MKEEWYQSMYHQIHLSDRQKNRIWAGVEDTGKSAAGQKRRLSLRGAVCVCAVLVASGITVLAANSSYVDKIAKALGDYRGNGEEPTSVESELYAAYGGEIDVSWNTEIGEVRLDAVLYDKGWLCIPYTVYLNDPLTASQSLSMDQVLGEDCSLQIKGAEDSLQSYYMISDRDMKEDGSLTGSLLLATDWSEGAVFAPGVVVQRVRKEKLPSGTAVGRRLEDGESTEGLKTYEVEVEGEIVTFVDLLPDAEVLTEIRLENAAAPQKEISTANVQLSNGITVDQIAVSPLALYICGTIEQAGVNNMDSFAGTNARVDFMNSYVVLKDGTELEYAQTGGSSEFKHQLGDDVITFSVNNLFAHAIDPDDVAGIRIIMDNGEQSYFIPVE